MDAVGSRPPKRPRPCQDVPELLAKGQLQAAKSVCRTALDNLEAKELQTETRWSIADLWYLLGLIHDMGHEHEEVEKCMRKVAETRA